MSDCHGILGWIFGHKFEARFDDLEELSQPTPEIVNSAIIADRLEELAEVYCAASTLYLQDVCVRCGAVVERKRPPESRLPPTSFAEQFYKERKQKWEKAQAYAAAEPGRVACPHCFHVFSADARQVSLICPACSKAFNPLCE